MDDPHDQAQYNAEAARQQEEDALDTVLTSPKSPRQLAVQAIRRAASVREGNGSAAQHSPRGVARMGLERSASDAARRLAMAKLTGETIVAWVCFIRHERHYLKPINPTVHQSILYPRHRCPLDLRRLWQTYRRVPRCAWPLVARSLRLQTAYPATIPLRRMGCFQETIQRRLMPCCRGALRLLRTVYRVMHR